MAESGDRPAEYSADHPAGHDAVRGPSERGSLFTGISTLCATAVRLTGVDGAAVAVISTGTRARELVYATDAIAQQLDELQFVVGEGPCVSAYLENRQEMWPNLALDIVAERWPAFTPDAMAMGARATFAFPVPGTRRPVGVLELYRSTVGALAEDEQQSAAAVALAVGNTLQVNWSERVHDAGSVESAMSISGFSDGPEQATEEFSRTEVYIASGMVAVQLAVSAADGLARLRAYAYAQGRPITEVAAEIVARRLSLRNQRDENHRD